VPAILAGGAALSWRLLVVGTAFYALVLVLDKLTIVVVPVFVALFLTAVLHGPVRYLRRHGWPRMAATSVSLFVAAVVIVLVGYVVVTHVSSQYDAMLHQVAGVRSQLQHLLKSLPGVSTSATVDELTGRLVTWLQQHRSAVVGDLLTIGRLAGSVLTGGIIALFLTFFFLADGARMWSWLVRLTPRSAQPSVNGAGHRAWRVLSGWVVGTAAIALFHGVVVGLVLLLLGSPLVLPLAVLVFLGSFIPLVGALLFGGLAVLVTLLSGGLVPALIMFGVLVVEDQIEAHLLQPLVVGRAVRLHPVAIVLVLTGAEALGGLMGMIFAVPLVASLHAAVKYLTGVEDIDGNQPHGVDRTEPLPPPRWAPLPYLVRARSDEGDVRAEAGAGPGAAGADEDGASGPS